MIWLRNVLSSFYLLLHNYVFLSQDFNKEYANTLVVLFRSIPLVLFKGYFNCVFLFTGFGDTYTCLHNTFNIGFLLTFWYLQTICILTTSW